MTFVLLYHYQQQEIALQKLEESFANLPQQKKLKRDKAAFVEKQKKFVHDKTELQKIVSRLEKSEREKAICEEEAKKQNELLYSGLVSSQREIASLNQQIESLQEKTENLQEKVLQMMEQKEEKEKALHIMQQDLQHDYNACLLYTSQIMYFSDGKTIKSMDFNTSIKKPVTIVTADSAIDQLYATEDFLYYTTADQQLFTCDLRLGQNIIKKMGIKADEFVVIDDMMYVIQDGILYEYALLYNKLTPFHDNQKVSDLGINGNYLYFLNEQNALCRIKTDGSKDSIVVASPVYSYTVYRLSLIHIFFGRILL